MVEPICFAAGTPLLTPEGAKPIEQFKAGDLVLSAPEDDPDGPVQARRVEAVFERSSVLFDLHVGGKLIRTTAEHPFYVQDKGWTAAKLLNIGDLLRSHGGQWLPVEATCATGEVVPVYNLRVEEYHTYFVGSEEWGFSIWVHNACDPADIDAVMGLGQVDEYGDPRNWKYLGEKLGSNGTISELSGGEATKGYHLFETEFGDMVEVHGTTYLDGFFPDKVVPYSPW